MLSQCRNGAPCPCGFRSLTICADLPNDLVPPCRLLYVIPKEGLRRGCMAYVTPCILHKTPAWAFSPHCHLADTVASYPFVVTLNTEQDRGKEKVLV
jgi:hypothetical protein